MQDLYVLFEIVGVFLQNPTFETREIERMLVLDFVRMKPLNVVGEITMNVGSGEDSFNHMAAKNSELDLILEVGVDIFALLDNFEQVHSHRPISKFKLIVVLLFDLQFVALLKPTNRHLMDYALDEGICVFVSKLILQLFILKLVQHFSVFFCFCTFFPYFWGNVYLIETFWHLS